MTDDSVTRRSVLKVAAAGAVLAGTGAAAQQREDLTKLTIDEASKRIAAKSLSPVDLTRAYLERIERVDKRINAYITVLADQALAQAKELEAELAAGKRRGPLHGIPLALKDNMDTAGIRTTAASAVYADRVPKEDARVREAFARRRRRVPRQVEHARVRVRRHERRHALRAGAQSMGPRAHSGRLVGRLGCGRRRALVRRCARHRHGGEHSFSRCGVRRRRLEGDARAREHSRHRAAVGIARSRGAARAQRRGRAPSS